MGISAFAPQHIAHPVMFQNWNRITFLHWGCSPTLLRPLVPARLEVDTFDGTGWVGLTPFVVDRLRPPFFLPVPWLSRFPETNARTYVRGPEGQRGVWFFSLDPARLLAVVGACLSFSLPYHWAAMSVLRSGRLLRYRSRRREAISDIEVEVGSEIEPQNDFDRFLTARFRLYAVRRGELRFAQVEHPPWSLRRARLRRFSQTILSSNSIPVQGEPPIVHYCHGVPTRIGSLRRQGYSGKP